MGNFDNLKEDGINEHFQKEVPRVEELLKELIAEVLPEGGKIVKELDNNRIRVEWYSKGKTNGYKKFITVRPYSNNSLKFEAFGYVLGGTIGKEYTKVHKYFYVYVLTDLVTYIRNRTSV